MIFECKNRTLIAFISIFVFIVFCDYSCLFFFKFIFLLVKKPKNSHAKHSFATIVVPAAILIHTLHCLTHTYAQTNDRVCYVNKRHVKEIRTCINTHLHASTYIYLCMYVWPLYVTPLHILLC